MEQTWTAVLVKRSSPGGWTYVVLPGTAELFGTRGRVAVRVAVDGEAYRTSSTALGDGTHELPVNAEVRRAIGTQAGDEVEVRLLKRVGPVSAASAAG